MCTYASSRVKRKNFSRKNELQMFLLISGGHIGAPKPYWPYWCTNMAPPYKSSTKERETFRQIAHKLSATKTWDLDKLFILFFLFGFFHWTVSNLFFCCVTVKKIYNDTETLMVRLLSHLLTMRTSLKTSNKKFRSYITKAEPQSGYF